jgi:hypothetical protein
MARPISWLPRLHTLCRSVNESVRSHYSCRDLARLFEIQPRSAQMLMRLLPTVQVGKSLLVERETLASLLARLAASHAPGAVMAEIRAQGRPPVVRRKLRELVLRDIETGDNALPANVAIGQGSLTIKFETVEELAASLWRLAMLLEEDLDGFAALYEPDIKAQEEIPAVTAEELADAAYIRDWLASRK